MRKKVFFKILNRGVKPLLFCFLFTKTSKVLHSSEGGLSQTDRLMSEEEEEGDDKKNGTFGSSLRGSGGFFSFKLLTDVSY